MQSEEQTKTREAEVQSKIAIEEAKAKFKMMIDKNLKDLEDRNEENSVERKEYLMGLEFDFKAELEGIQTDSKDVLAAREAARKAKLQRQEATQQSAITAQSDPENGQSNAPVNFESQFDNTNPTDLGTFEPD